MKGAEKVILLAVFVVPIVICIVILKSIWAEDEEYKGNNAQNSNDNNSAIVSISDEIVYQSGDEIISGDAIQSLQISSNNSNNNSGNTNKPVQESKLYEDAIVNAALADVYTTQDVTSERIGSITKNTKIVAQKYSNGWSNVSGIDSKGVGISGWMKSDNITFPDMPNGDLNVSAGLPTGIVTAEPYLNVRLNPSTTAEIIAKINKGEKVTIQESTNGWHKVTVNGQTGWVSTQYIK